MLTVGLGRGCTRPTQHGFSHHHDHDRPNPWHLWCNMVATTSTNAGRIASSSSQGHATYTWAYFGPALPSIQPFMHADIDGMILCRQGHKWIFINFLANRSWSRVSRRWNRMKVETSSEKLGETFEVFESFPPNKSEKDSTRSVNPRFPWREEEKFVLHSDSERPVQSLFR